MKASLLFSLIVLTPFAQGGPIIEDGKVSDQGTTTAITPEAKALEYLFDSFTTFETALEYVEKHPETLGLSASGMSIADDFFGIHCETSNGSPFNADVTKIAEKIFYRNGNALQYNTGGSKCTTLDKHGSAAVGVCGTPYDGHSWKIFSFYVRFIGGHCVRNSKTGGWLGFIGREGHRMRAIVFHS